MSSLKIPTKANLWWWSTHHRKVLNMSSSTAVVILCGDVKTIAECNIYTLFKKCSDFSQR